MESVCKCFVITMGLALLIIGCGQSAATTEKRALDPEAQAMLKLIESGKPATLESYLKENPDAVKSHDAEGLTLLHYAAQHSQDDMIKLLVQNGADVNAQDRYNATPLRGAVDVQAKPSTIALLKSFGAEM